MFGEGEKNIENILIKKYNTHIVELPLNNSICADIHLLKERRPITAHSDKENMYKEYFSGKL